MDTPLPLLAIGGVLGVLWIGLHLLQRRQRLAGPPRLSIEQRLPVSGQCHLILVRWDGRELLLASTSQSCQLIAEGPRA